MSGRKRMGIKDQECHRFTDIQESSGVLKLTAGVTAGPI